MSDQKASPAGFPSLESAFHYLEAFANFERQTPMREAYRLDRMAALLELCGNPQLALPAIHISGSKGKGTTARYCAALLHANGLRVGIYASPHLLDWRERICRPDGFFGDHVYLDAIGKIRKLVDDLRDNPGWVHGDPTTFELLTLAAYLIFREAKLDWMVIETGLGGLLDATNLMQPAACLITALELEHTDILGDSIEEIAAQKAGIFKQDARLFAQEPSHDGERIRPVLEDAARRVGGKLQWIALDEGDPNRAIALAAIQRLCRDGLIAAASQSAEWTVRMEATLDDVRLPGRLEWYENGSVPPVRLLLDVAHTPDSVARALKAFQPSKGDVLLFGSVSGKRHEAMAALLASHFSSIIVTTPGSFKKSDPEQVYHVFRQRNPGTVLIADPEMAFREALASLQKHAGTRLPGNGRLLVCGSFYLAAAVHGAMESAGFRPVIQASQRRG